MKPTGTLKTDKDRLVDLLNSFGITGKPIPTVYGEKVRGYADCKPADGCSEYPQSILLHCGCGYEGFVCEFYFDESGKYLDYGVWE